MIAATLRPFVVSPLLRFLVFLLPLSAFSQTYPVQVNTNITPPYSVFLSDYISTESNSFNVLINLLELDRTNLRVKLRLTIEGAGITLRTRSGYVPQPIVLQGGVPEMLTGYDLRSYFNPDNLDFTGISRSDFMKIGRLPEGFYTFTIEVLDYVRGVRLSSPTGGRASAMIMLNDPPLLMRPFNGDKIIATDPQNIMFSWTPRHTGSPNAAFSTEYEFRLVELYPGQTNPDVAIRSSNSIYTTTTTMTSLNYGILEPTLIPGKKYAYRIRARDTSGRDMFRNQGYSETYAFIYGDACIPAVNVSAASIDAHRVKVEWDPDVVHSKFNVSLRKTGGSWYTLQSYTRSQIFPDLDPGTQYEYRVQPVCGSVTGDFSTIYSITTLTEEEEQTQSVSGRQKYSCGAEPPPIEGEEATCMIPLQKPLLPLDVIKVGDLNVVVTKVIRNPNGSYGGEGHVSLPMLNFVNFRVVLRSAVVSEHYRLIGGSIVTVYDETNRPVGDRDATIAEIKAEMAKEKAAAAAGENAKTPAGQQITADRTEFIQGEIASVTDNEDGTVTIQLEGGQTQTVALPAEGEVLAIRDASGDIWTVDSKGNVSQAPPGSIISGSGPAAAAPADQKIDFVIQFAADQNQRFGFDNTGKNYQPIARNYTKTTLSGKEYWVAAKSIASGSTDLVEGKMTGGQPFPEYVGFKTSLGNLDPQAGSDGHSKRLTLPGGLNKDSYQVTAFAVKQTSDSTKEEVAVGTLNVYSYDLIRNKVILVPVNGVSKPDAGQIHKRLNEIYGQAVAQWEVTVDKEFKVEASLLEGFDEGESGLLASFPDKMREFNRKFKQSRTIDNQAYYLFLIEGTNFKNSGFMPFKRQMGYIYVDNSNDIPRTIAHELGHGAFRLRHTFSSEDFVADKGRTDNLMDYLPAGAGPSTGQVGTHLLKHQWDNVHDPVSLSSWLQDDSESAERCFWYQSAFAYWDQSANNVNIYQPMFKEVRTNFKKYFELSKTGNIDISGFEEWKVRKESHENNNTTLIENLIFELFKSKPGEISLYENGVTLGSYDIDGKKFDVAAFSWKKSAKINKKEVDQLCKIEGDEDVFVVVGEDYILVNFLNEKEMELTIQINSGGKENAALWLEYLGILIKSGEQREKNRQRWEQLINQRSGVISGDSEFDYFVSVGNAWFRKKEDPYSPITPNPPTAILAKGLQVSVLDIVKDGKVAKIKLKSSGEIEFTTLSNLTQVKNLPNELSYKVIEDYNAIDLPYSSTETGVSYKAGDKFIVNKKCGDYYKIKGVGDAITGHWIIASILRSEVFEKMLTSLQSKSTMTVSEISNIRAQIEQLGIEEEKGDLYIELQSKVPYSNQRDNEAPATESDLKKHTWMTSNNITTAGEIMCNLTSQAMCLTYLGVNKPCSGCSENCNTYSQIEDYLECVRVDKKFDERDQGTARKDLAKLFNVEYKYLGFQGLNTSEISEMLGHYLRKGHSVSLGGFGHMVRLQSISESGVIVDDPYGKIVNFTAGGVTGKYKKDGKDYRNGEDFGEGVGEDNFWTWDQVINQLKVTYGEAYGKK